MKPTTCASAWPTRSRPRSQLADGLVEIARVDGEDAGFLRAASRAPSTASRCPSSTPRLFSFNSPHGACPRCTGLGAQLEIDPDADRPRRRRSRSRRRARAVERRTARASSTSSSTALARALRVRRSTRPGASCPKEQQDLSCTARATSELRHLPAAARALARLHDAVRGHHPGLERRYRETESALQKERHREYMTHAAVPGVRRRAAASPSRSRSRSASSNIDQFAQLVGTRRARVLRRGSSSRETERMIAERVLARDPRAARVPRRRRARLPDARPRRGDALGRRGAAHPARDADRLEPGRRAVHPRRAVDRPAPARQRSACIATLERLRDLGNTVIVVEHDEETMRAAD